MGSTGPAPRISVIMASYMAGKTVGAALRSVLDQTMGDLEVIVSDDASGDDSVARVAEVMAVDGRVRLIRSPANAGPAACRNRALDAARGEWIAVVDADDLIHPERFERLLAAAAHFDADIVADDLLHFHDDGAPPRLLFGMEVDRPFRLSAESWVRAGTDGSPSLGYLKPLIRAEALGDRRYDETLRIGEDYDLVLRLLIGGADMVVVPEPFYLYRRHGGSISHRLSVADLEAMIEAQLDLCAMQSDIPSALGAAFAERLAQLRTGLGYERLVAAIKARHAGRAIALLLAHPGHGRRLWRSWSEGRQRRAVADDPVAVPSHLSLGAEASVEPGWRQVPAYRSVADIDWSAPIRRQDWLDLAAIGRSGALPVSAMDAAGTYAAGFIPLARIEDRLAQPVETLLAVAQ